MTKTFVCEKLFNGNAQAITKFLNGGGGGTVVATADNIVDGGLGHAAHGAKFVDGKAALFAQF